MTRADDPLAARAGKVVTRIRGGDRRVLGRAITEIETGSPLGLELARRFGDMPPRGHVIGLTGPPGVGESTLISALSAALADQGRRVAAVLLDPSSPVSSGGAVLGDRIRFPPSGEAMRSTSDRSGTAGTKAA